jgi:hypothetical protein
MGEGVDVTHLRGVPHSRPPIYESPRVAIYYQIVTLRAVEDAFPLFSGPRASGERHVSSPNEDFGSKSPTVAV